MNNLLAGKSELGLSFLLILLLVLAYDPFGFTMTDSLQMTILVLFLLALAIFLMLFWKEKSKDEREELHRLITGKIAYTAGVITLTIVIAIQLLEHEFDIWAPITLAVMIISKLFGRIFLEMRD